MNYKSFNDLRNDIKKHLPTLQGHNFDLVVGLPRSGMIPAYIIALFLNIECTDLTSFINNVRLKKGRTRPTKSTIEYPHDAKNILVVDDSIWSGESLKRDLSSIPSFLISKLTSLAIYSTEKARDDIDLFFEHVPTPRLFEWNIFHHKSLSEASVDIDGVLCVDPTTEQNDDGEAYKNFILNAQPLFIPTTEIHSLVTSRLEKYRAETETWLNKNGIAYKHLIMLDLPNKEERLRLGAHGKHKASYFKSARTQFFIESEVSQAKEICVLSGKPVYCVDNNTFYQPNTLSLLKNNPRGFKKYIPNRIFKILLHIRKALLSFK